MDAHWEQVRQQYYLVSVLRAEIANRSMRPPKKWVTAADFMDIGPAKRRERSNRAVSSFRSWLEEMRLAGKVVTVNG